MGKLCDGQSMTVEGALVRDSKEYFLWDVAQEGFRPFLPYLHEKFGVS